MMLRLCRFQITCAALVAAFASVVPAPSHASGSPSSASRSFQLAGDGVSFSIGNSIGLVEGTATELSIYYPYGKKFKLSELTWDLENVVMAGVHGSIEVGRRFRFDLGVWSALSAGTGMMVDRDWDYPDEISVFLEPTDQNWTDESRHPDTSVDKGTIVDLNLSVMALQTGPFRLRGIVGYKNDTWNWSSRGGTYIYSTEYPGSRDAMGTFPAGQEVITYEQRYSIPYIGVGASLTWPAVQVESHLLYSPLVFARDTDDHVLRGVLFEGDFSGGTYVGLGLSATWAFARHWVATLGVEYQTIPEITGDVTVSGAEGYGYYPDGGGIAMNAALVTMGAGYHF